MITREEINKYTPKDQRSEDKKLINKLVHLARKLTENNDDEFVVRPIKSFKDGGMYEPSNLEILAKKDFFKIKENESTAGSITIENILGKKSMRYQGRFVKGISMKEQRDAPPTKAEKIESEDDEFMKLYDDLNAQFDERSHDYFQEAIALLGRTAHMFKSPTRAELQKWCDKFGNYYKPKLTSVEQKGAIDNQIQIKLIMDEPKEEPKLVEEIKDEDK